MAGWRKGGLGRRASARLLSIGGRLLALRSPSFSFILLLRLLLLAPISAAWSFMSCTSAAAAIRDAAAAAAAAVAEEEEEEEEVKNNITTWMDGTASVQDHKYCTAAARVYGQHASALARSGACARRRGL